MDYQRCDAMLMEILQQHKTITGFLDAVFGFLKRNTDFYHTKTHAAEKIGFEQGMRELVLFTTMQRYDPSLSLTAETFSESGEAAPAALEEITIDGTDREQRSIPEVDNPLRFPDKKSNEMCFVKSDYKNGAKYENYCWSQTLKDVELHVRLPEDLQQAKQLNMQISGETFSISSRSQPERIIIAGQLSARIKHNDVVWTIDAGKLLINCDKAKEYWWERFFVGEESIDIKKIDCEQYIDELPEDAQAEIEKICRQDQCRLHI